MTLYKWSQTASADATADSTINWAEGQSPSSVNDSARAMMAATAKYRDDIAGAIVTGGTSTAYTVTSYQVFDTLAHLGGQMIAFVPHTSNGGSCTLNVDSLGAKPLRIATGTDPTIGQLIVGTPYTVTYSAADGIFYLHGVYANPQSAIPLGACLPYFGTAAPNSYFAFPAGQAISRTTYGALFSLFGTTYGSGDGLTTFNLPDVAGRVLAGKEAIASRLTSVGGGIDGATLGSANSGNNQNVTLITANLPPYTPAGSLSSITSTSSTIMQSSGPADNFTSVAGASTFDNQTRSAITSTGTFAGTAQGGTSTPFRIVQPTIVCNYIMRVL